jgi:hypothetical protein
VVRAMLTFMYDFDYAHDRTACPAAVFHAKVYAMSVEYEIDALKAKAKNKFKQEVQAQWNHDDFLLAIREVYEENDNELCELRTIVIDTSYEHIKDLLDKEAFTDVMD